MTTTGHVVDVNERALEDGFHRLIIDGLALQARGWKARQQVAIELSARGMRPAAIARELAARARQAGCREEDLRCLGISEHNVRVMLRRAQIEV